MAMTDDLALIAWKVKKTTEIQDEMAAEGRTSELLWARDCKKLLDHITAAEQERDKATAALEDREKLLAAACRPGQQVLDRLHGLAALLARVGVHQRSNPRCEGWSGAACTCGLYAALAAPPVTEGGLMPDSCLICGGSMMPSVCNACGQPKGHGYGCAAHPGDSPAETERELERVVVDAAIAHVLAERRLSEAMARAAVPYRDVKARDDARRAIEAAVDAAIARRGREAEA